MRLSPLLVALLLMAFPGWAATHHVDPAAGPARADGSAQRPWPSLARALRDGGIADGDRILLHDGDHGLIEIAGARIAGTVTIEPAPGAAPKAAGLWIAGSEGLHLRGLAIRPDRPPEGLIRALVRTDRASARIAIEGFDIASANTTDGWTKDDWRARAHGGIYARGRQIVLRGNTIRNTRHALILEAENSVAERNLIENFAGDGMRGIADHVAFLGNEVRNCYDIGDGNHDDGFQSFSRGPDGKGGGGVITGGVLVGNLIVNYTDPDQPMVCDLQGIGMFDGIFRNWVIANNIVAVNHWHGITVMGAENVRIVNNTVIDLDREKPGPPWISITHHKDGRPPVASLVANNVAMPPPRSPNGQFNLPKPGVATRGNVIVPFLGQAFAFYARGDLSLPPGSPAAGAADPAFAPARDFFGRPRGPRPSAGAVEPR